MAAACPVLDRLQVIVAGVGVVVGELLVQLLNASAGGVFTTRLTAVDVALPTLGVAVSVPEYVPALVAVVTVSVPQLALAAHAPVGPLTVAPLMAE